MMMIRKVNNHAAAARWVILAIIISPTLILAQSDNQTPPVLSPNTNPIQREIIPRQDQSAEQQAADQLACYEWVCQETDWDPYEAYDALVAAGYAVALSKREKTQGLVCLAAHGAVTGTIAGELLDEPEGESEFHAEEAAEIGAAIALASGLIRSAYLNETDDVQAARIIRRFESELRKWDRKYSACLSRKGYKIPSS